MSSIEIFFQMIFSHRLSGKIGSSKMLHHEKFSVKISRENINFFQSLHRVEYMIQTNL